MVGNNNSSEKSKIGNSQDNNKSHIVHENIK